MKVSELLASGRPAFKALALSCCLFLGGTFTYQAHAQVQMDPLVRAEKKVGFVPQAKDMALYKRMQTLENRVKAENADAGMRPELYPDWTPKKSEPVGGEMIVSSFTIPKGQKVEVTEDLFIYSFGKVVIEGELVAAKSTPDHKDGVSIVIRSDKGIVVNGTLQAGNGLNGLERATKDELYVEGGSGGSLLLKANNMMIRHDIYAGHGGNGYHGGDGGEGGSVLALGGKIKSSTGTITFYGGNGGNGGAAPEELPENVLGVPGGNGGDGGDVAKVKARFGEKDGPAENGSNGASNTAAGGQDGQNGGACQDGGDGANGPNAVAGHGGDGEQGEGAAGSGGNGGSGGDAFGGEGGDGGEAGDCCSNVLTYNSGGNGGDGGNGGNAVAGNGGNGGDGANATFLGDGEDGGDGGDGGNATGGNGGDGGNGGNGSAGGSGGTSGSGGTATSGQGGAGGSGGNGVILGDGSPGTPGVAGTSNNGIAGSSGTAGIYCPEPTEIRIHTHLALPNENYFKIVDKTTEEVLVSRQNITGGTWESFTYSLDHYHCYEFIMYDATGDGFAGGGQYSIYHRGGVAVTSTFQPQGRDRLYEESQSFGLCSGNKANLDPEDLTVRIVPNPAEDRTTIKFNRTPEGTTKIILRDLQGRVIAINETSNTDQFQMDLSNLQAGLYVVTIKNGEWTQTQKVVKN